MATETGKTLQVMENETGELVEIPLDNWEGPTDQELVTLTKFSEIGPEPILVVKIGWSEGKRAGIEGKPCALIAYMQPSTDKGLHGAYSFSESVVASLRNLEARGKCTPQKPLPCKVGRSGPTSAGYFVDKIVALDAREEAELKKQLSQ